MNLPDIVYDKDGNEYRVRSYDPVAVRLERSPAPAQRVRFAYEATAHHHRLCHPGAMMDNRIKSTRALLVDLQYCMDFYDSGISIASLAGEALEQWISETQKKG